MIRRLGRYPALIAFVSYAALALALYPHTWASPTHRWLGDPGDPPMFMWSLRWYPYALAHGLNPFFTHHIDLPHGVNLLWDTSIPLPSLVATPITLVFGPLVAFNVLGTSAAVLASFCAYLCFRRYVTSHVAAGAGALLFGFSPYVVAQTRGGHLQMSLAFTAPLMLLLLDEILVRQRRRVLVVGTALGVLAAAQLLIGQEVLATELVTSIVGLVIVVLLRPRQVRDHLSYAARALAIGAAVFALLGAVPIGMALLSSRAPNNNAIFGTNTFVSDVDGFVVPSQLQELHPAWASKVTSDFTDSCCVADTHTYLGVPLMLLLAFTAITRWRRLVVRFASLLAIAMAVLSLGPQLHVRGHVFRHINLPERWIANLPLLNNMLVSRLMLYVYLCAGLLVAVALDGIWRTEIPGHKSRRRTVYAVLTITAVTVSYALVFPDVGFPATPATVPTFFSSGLVRRVPANSVALVAPFARDTNTSEPMLWQAVADMRYRTPAGYATGRLDDGQFGFLPEPTPLSKLMQDIQYGHPIRALDDGTRAELIAELRADHVATVIVGPFDTRDNMVELFTRLLSRPPEHVGGVDIWWHVT